MRSRGVPRDCSLRTSNRDANGLVLVAAVVRAKDWRMIGAYIARLRTSGWKTELKVAGKSTLISRVITLPNIFGVGSFMRRMCASLPRLQGAEPDRSTWQAAHKAFVEAFVEPPDAAWQKKLARVLSQPPPKEVADALFTYDGFLHGLGRMSLSA